MNIYAKAGHKVVYLDKNGNVNEPADARALGLVKGQTYTVDFLDVRGFISYVGLKEVLHASFNTVMFEDAELEMKPPEPKMFYIRSQNHDQYMAKGNELAMWWCPKSSGYTFDLTKAGQYTKAEALSICGPFGVECKTTGRGRFSRTTPDNIAYPVEMVSNAAFLMVNKYDVENQRVRSMNGEAGS